MKKYMLLVLFVACLLVPCASAGEREERKVVLPTNSGVDDRLTEILNDRSKAANAVDELTKPKKDR